MVLPASGSTSIPVQCWGGAAEDDSGNAFLYAMFWGHKGAFGFRSNRHQLCHQVTDNKNAYNARWFLLQEVSWWSKAQAWSRPVGCRLCRVLQAKAKAADSIVASNASSMKQVDQTQPGLSLRQHRGKSCFPMQLISSPAYTYVPAELGLPKT